MATRRPIFLLLWLVAAAFIFAWTMVSYHAQAVPQLRDEILLRHGLVMLILTLPSGLIWTAGVGSIVSLIGFELVGMADAALVSLTLLPWLWRKWKAKG